MKFRLLILAALAAFVTSALPAADVSVVGAVAKPGHYSTTGSKGVVAVLLEAGGLTPDGCSEVTVLSQQDGRKRLFHVNLWELIAEFRPDWKLEPGDEVSVPQHSVACIRDMKAFNALLADYVAAREQSSDVPRGWKEKLKDISGGHGKLHYLGAQRAAAPVPRS